MNKYMIVFGIYTTDRITFTGEIMQKVDAESAIAAFIEAEKHIVPALQKWSDETGQKYSGVKILGIWNEEFPDIKLF